MGAARDQANSYLQQQEDTIADLQKQLAEALGAQSLAEIRAATAEMNLATAEARAAQAVNEKMDEMRATMSTLQGSEALSRASAEALSAELARERTARTEAEAARVAESKRVDAALAEFAKARSTIAPAAPAPAAPAPGKAKVVRSIVRERDGNGEALVIDHQVVE